MKLFLYKILKFTSPLIVLTFFIIFFHKSIYKKPYFQKNRSDDLVEILKNNNKKNYNTLILGNSRSQMLKAKNFNKNLKSEETSFHFDNPGGNIYHFYHSLDYFLKNYNAKNIILFLDGQSLKFNDTEPFYHTSLSPKISGNYLKFYFNYFKLFYNYKMIVSIILKESNIDLPDYFKGFISDNLNYSQTDFETGDITFNIDKLIEINKDSVYESSIFEKRFQNNYKYKKFNKKISENHLKKLKTLLIKNDLNFIVIIPPVYLSNSTSDEDINMIKKIFDDKLLNFSIDSITNNKYFFKDYSHFNEKFGNYIYKEIDL